MKTKLLLIMALGLVSIKGISQNPNLIAQYSFTGNATDSIGSNDGVVHGATLCPDRYGNANSAYNYNAANSQYIEFPIAPLEKPNYTYSAWVLLNSYPSSGGRFVVLSIGGIGGDQGISFGNNYNGGGIIYNGFGTYSYFNNGTLANISANEGTLPTLNAWHHIVSVRDSSYSKLYFDGVLVNTSASSSGSLPIYGTSNKTAIIGTRYNQSLPFDGKIDDVGIYDRALNAAEVKSIYIAQRPNGCLIAEHSFTGNANDSIGSNNGVVHGATLCPDRFGNANSAYNFNAANSQYIEFPITPLEKPNYTYSAWVLLNSYPSSGGRFVVLSIGGIGGDQGISFGNNYNGGGIIYNGFGTYSYFNNGTLANISANESTLPTLNTWHHVVAVRDSSYSKLYFDGVLVNTSASSSGSLPIYGTSNKTAIIGTRYNQSLPFDGKIDDVGIYDCALNAAEVNNLWNTQSTTSVGQLYNDGSINVFPNPAIAEIFITGLKGKTIIRMYDILGKLILEKEAYGNSTLNTSQLPSGAYILLTENNIRRSYNRIVLSK